MFNLKPENLVGDTNKLLFSILTELKQLNESVQSLRPIAKDVVVESKVVKPKIVKSRTLKKDKSKKEVVKNVGSNLEQRRKLPEDQS